MILLHVLFACGEGEKEEAEIASTPTSSHMSVADFENVNCQDYNGAEGYGAGTYYVGNFVLNGESLSGIESAFFMANENLSELEEWESGSCEIHWVVTGGTTSPVGCASCDIAFSLQASMSIPDSTCPEDLRSGFESMELFYNVERAGDGTSTWYMEEGAYLGSGIHRDDGTMTYVSDEDCKWF